MKLAISLGLVLSAALAAQPNGHVLTVSPFDDQLRTVDPLTALTASMVTITVGGAPILGANGLAIDPLNGDLWTVVRGAVSGRSFAKLNPVTGVATVIGSSGENFAGIAFDVTGVLFAVTGDGSSTPEALFSVDKTTGAATFRRPLGAGSDGEALGSNPEDGRLYHASGLGLFNVDEFLEWIDPFTLASTWIPLSGDDYEEVTGITHWVGNNMLFTDLCDELFVVSTSGVVSRQGLLDHTAKGLVFVPLPTVSAPFTLPYSSGCAGAGGHVPLLHAVGTPTSSGRVTLGLRNALGGAPAALLLGAGSSALPNPVGCGFIRIFPILPITVPATLSGAAPGDGEFTITLPFGTVMSPLDVYFQGFVLDGGALVLSNGLQIHQQ